MAQWSSSAIKKVESNTVLNAVDFSFLFFKYYIKAMTSTIKSYTWG